LKRSRLGKRLVQPTGCPFGARRISVSRFYLFRKSNVIEHLIELGLMAWIFVRCV
jgi:hypothetical protein